jgi:hypothetical protein
LASGSRRTSPLFFKGFFKTVPLGETLLCLDFVTVNGLARGEQMRKVAIALELAPVSLDTTLSTGTEKE